MVTAARHAYLRNAPKRTLPESPQPVAGAQHIGCAVRTQTLANAKKGLRSEGLVRRAHPMPNDVDYVSMSAQILRAQLFAYTPSSALASGDNPPAPATANIVFCAAS